MNEIELRINQQVGLLDWNFAEINRVLDENLEKYSGIVITENDIKEAKAIKADLNRIKGQIEDRRKLAKAEFCKPYDQFAEQVKVVTGKIDKVMKGIDVQLKEFESREKQAKYECIREYWETECVTDPAVDFQKVFDDKYLNKTCSEKQWKKSLDEKKQGIEQNLQVISNIEQTAKRDYILSEYMVSLNLGDAMNKWEQYSEKLRQAEEFRRQAEERAKKTIEQMKNEPQMSAEATETPKIERNEDQRAIPSQAKNHASEAVYQRCMMVWGTYDQLMALADYMNKIGVKFKKVELKDGSK